MNCLNLEKLFGKILPAALICLLLFFQAAGAGTLKVAVFPLEDLSQGANGVNLPLTRFLSRKLEERGVKVVPLERMINHMARKRIRWLGFLETADVLKINDELGADIVFFGTISQYQEEEPASLGLILTAVDAASSRTIWTESGALNSRDVCNVLGLAEPQEVEELRRMLAERLLRTWPRDLSRKGKGGRPLIRSSLIEPAYVKPGEKVSCFVRLYPPNPFQLDPAELMRNDMTIRYSGAYKKVGENGSKGPERRRVQLMVGDNDYLSMEERAANYYKVSWPAPDRNDSIPVSLILKEPGAGKKIFFLGSYRVDNQAPGLSLKLKARDIGGSKVFSEALTVIPVWQDPEPVSRWILLIRNQEGVLAGTEGEGGLPGSFQWEGQRADGYQAADGVYDIVLKVWDRAGNRTVLNREVTLKANPPELLVGVEDEGDGLLVSLDSNSTIPLDSWTARIHRSDGRPVLEKQGYTLPARLEVPLAADQDGSRLEGIITVRDVLGNQGRREFKGFSSLVSGEKETGEQEKREWLEEF